ncbi:hypothetical protein BV20DRAFT_200706 [Pilatotrama ljubarskyi]|nr:hypothetical protein BV20DRAFT_200706 [Pilatotrama ljubarskyi]
MPGSIRGQYKRQALDTFRRSALSTHPSLTPASTITIKGNISMVEVLRAQDQFHLPKLTTTTDDWLARDHDIEVPVYLFVYPSHTTVDPHHARWSISWPVGGRSASEMVAWRHVHADAYDNEAGLETDPPRYVYGGAITKTAGPGTVLAKRFLLAVMSLAMRKRIEELAAETPLALMEESYPSDADGQAWIVNLLDRMVASELISSAARDHIIQQASTAFLTPHSPLILGLPYFECSPPFSFYWAPSRSKYGRSPTKLSREPLIKTSCLLSQRG